MDINYVIQEYRKGRSTHVIARELNTYANKIRDILIGAGEPLRNKSEAQRKYLELGGKHPTKGQKRPEEVKNKISAKVKEKRNA